MSEDIFVFFFNWWSEGTPNPRVPLIRCGLLSLMDYQGQCEVRVVITNTDTESFYSILFLLSQHLLQVRQEIAWFYLIGFILDRFLSRLFDSIAPLTENIFKKPKILIIKTCPSPNWKKIHFHAAILYRTSEYQTRWLQLTWFSYSITLNVHWRQK